VNGKGPVNFKNVTEGVKMTIIGYNCGKKCKQKFLSMGLIKGKEFKIVCKEPSGPYVIEDKDGHQLTIGQGMFEKLIIEE